MRKYLPLFLVLALLLSAAAPAQAVTVSWNFASGLDRRNFRFSTNVPTNIFLDDSQGNLRIYSNYFSGSGVAGGWISSLFKVRGDFEISVDYQLNKTIDYGSYVQFMLNDPLFVLVRAYDDYHVYTGSWPSAVGQPPKCPAPFALSGSAAMFRLMSTIVFFTLILVMVPVMWILPLAPMLTIGVEVPWTFPLTILKSRLVLLWATNPPLSLTSCCSRSRPSFKPDTHPSGKVSHGPCLLCGKAEEEYHLPLDAQTSQTPKFHK